MQSSNSNPIHKMRIHYHEIIQNKTTTSFETLVVLDFENVFLKRFPLTNVPYKLINKSPGI